MQTCYQIEFGDLGDQRSKMLCTTTIDAILLQARSLVSHTVLVQFTVAKPRSEGDFEGLNNEKSLSDG